jgi:hypothetical protein
MSRAIRVVFTIVVLLVVWIFRRTRGAAILALLAGAWLRRAWVTRPARTGTLGRRAGPPRWVRAASGRVAGKTLAARRQEHTGDLFDPTPPSSKPPVQRWW